MRLDRLIKFNGNMNRIREMREGGVGVNGQAGIFADFGMKVTAEDMSNVERVVDELSRKALPKKAAKAMIRAVGVMKEIYGEPDNES